MWPWSPIINDDKASSRSSPAHRAELSNINLLKKLIEMGDIAAICSHRPKQCCDLKRWNHWNHWNRPQEPKGPRAQGQSSHPIPQCEPNPRTHQPTCWIDLFNRWTLLNLTSKKRKVLKLHILYCTTATSNQFRIRFQFQVSELIPIQFL